MLLTVPQLSEALAMGNGGNNDRMQRSVARGSEMEGGAEKHCQNSPGLRTESADGAG